VKCVSCGKGIRHSQKGWTWKEAQKCPACFRFDNNLKKVKINRVSKQFELVYVSKNVQIL